MVQIRCDKCDKTIDVENAVVGQKVTCPHCGDVNLIRAAGGAATTRADRAAAAGFPPAEGPEVDVRRIRPAMFRASPLKFLLFVLLILAGLAGTILFPPFWYIGLGGAVLATGFLIAWKLRTLGEGMILTNKRIVDREGFFRRETSEIRYSDIKNVQIRQSFMQRLLGVGTIAISTAAEHEDEVAMDDVPRPDEVARIVDLYRQL